jgi:hypothetical protein
MLHSFSFFGRSFATGSWWYWATSEEAAGRV